MQTLIKFENFFFVIHFLLISMSLIIIFLLSVHLLVLITELVIYLEGKRFFLPKKKKTILEMRIFLISIGSKCQKVKYVEESCISLRLVRILKSKFLEGVFTSM